MNHNRQPLSKERGVLRGVGGVVLAFALTACQSPGRSESEPSQAPTAHSARAAVTAGKICTGFFTQKLQGGDVWVVGRPLMGDDGRPQEVLAGRAGVIVEPATPQEGDVAWYSLGGKPLDSEDVNCRQSPLYARQLTQPNDSKIWVATTNQAAAVPKYWDAHALEPAGFGGVGLNYGTMPAANLVGILNAARQ